MLFTYEYNARAVFIFARVSTRANITSECKFIVDDNGARGDIFDR